MKLNRLMQIKGLALFALLSPLLAFPVSAFDSGSTGVDGPFAPVSDATIVLPANGILNYTTMNIPSGVTVTIAGNNANTPAFILVQGDAVIDGNIDVSGVDAESISSSPPGGFAGGLPSISGGGNGRGPGGGLGARTTNDSGNGGSYATPGSARVSSSGIAPTYGSTSLQPLLGGSGGGSSRSSNTTSGTIPGNRGGGGGGAILLAVSGTLNLNGAILANGGDGGDAAPPETSDYGGGGGSGGAVRLIASELSGGGSIDISGGDSGRFSSGSASGGFGGMGRARLEADIFSFAGSITPNIVSTSAPQPVFASNLPVLRIVSVGGSAVQANPQGENDVILPSSISNPVIVELAATDIPLGSTIELTVTPASGTSTTVTSTGLAGTVADSTASASANLPQGASVLTASVSFATASLSNPIYARYTDGEKVARVEIQATMGAGSNIWITTESGRVIALPPRIANL